MNAHDIPTYVQGPDGEEMQVCSKCLEPLWPPSDAHPLCDLCEPEDAQDEKRAAQSK